MLEHSFKNSHCQKGGITHFINLFRHLDEYGVSRLKTVLLLGTRITETGETCRGKRSH
jgi:hypothetical protein